MFRPDKSILWISLITAYALTSNVVLVFAHSGHKHEEKLRVSLPDVVAKINGEDIRSDNITRELKKALTNYKDRGMPLSTEQEEIAVKKLIDNEIGRALLLQKGKEIGAKISAEMLDKKIKSSFESNAVFEHELKNNKMTIEQYKKQLKAELLMQQVIDREIKPNIKVSESDIKSFYEKNKENFIMGKKARASVILIKAERGDEKSKKLARKKIENALEEIKNGADFSAIATKYSQDSLASKGGDLGYFTKKQMFGAFSSRAFNMNVGEVSEIFKTVHGFHILKLTDLKKGDTLSLDNAKERIERKLRKNKLGSATLSYLEALKQKSDIKMYF